jgi:hypothetical protein
LYICIKIIHLTTKIVAYEEKTNINDEHVALAWIVQRMQQ